MLNTEKKPKEKWPKIMIYNGKTITSTNDKVLAFHDLFSAIMTSSATPITEDTVYDVFISSWSNSNEELWHEYINSVTNPEVESVILEMDPNKSPGPSNLSSKTAKLVTSELSTLMTKVLNTILETSIVPRCWKESLLQPIPKKGDRKEIKKYRGIAMQSIISKVIDKIITKKLSSIISCLIHEIQHGFTKSRSTSTNLLDITSYINNSLTAGLRWMSFIST